MGAQKERAARLWEQAARERKARPSGLSFANPEMIASLTNGRRSGPNQWVGHCPCHDDRHPSLSIAWGRNRTKTLLQCFAGCAFEALAQHFREKHRLSLDLTAPPPKRSDPGSVRRALRFCSRNERRIHDFLDERGDGPATYEQLMLCAGNNRRSVAKALRGLEYLGLVQIERGKLYWSDEGRPVNPPNVYAVATDRLFRHLPADDKAVIDNLRAMRLSEQEARRRYGEQASAGSGSFATDSYVYEISTSGNATGDGGLGCGPAPTGPKRGKPSGRLHLAMRRYSEQVFGALCVGRAIGAGGVWRGTVLALAGRPPGVRMWPRSRSGILDWLWAAREDMADCGYGYRLEHDAGSRRMFVSAVVIEPVHWEPF